LSDDCNEFVNQQTNQQKKVKPQKQKADPDQGSHLNARLRISRVYVFDLIRQALIEAGEDIHSNSPFGNLCKKVREDRADPIEC
jgi:hypothetical protein